MTTLLTNFKQRGCIHDVSNFEHLENLLGNHNTCFYCGFDPTASSLHVGSMLPLLLMQRLQEAGHTPIVLLGSATGMIGDPSGKSEERVQLSEENLKHNTEGIEKQIGLFLSSSGENAFRLLRNDSWLKSLNYIEFLRDIGKLFSVNAMMAKESVKARLENREQGISYTEFSYMLLQAYDYYWLNRNHNCRLQVGGSDQWGNITAGIDLIRRLNPENHPQAFALTFPLLTTSSGSKFGKTEHGTVWLDPERTSSYQFYQFWLNTADADVIRYLELFTDLEEEELADIRQSFAQSPQKRTAQKKLAEILSGIVHGKEETARAISASSVLFGGEIKNISADILLDIFSDVPSTTISKEEAVGKTAVDLFILSQLTSSKGAARRLIEGGGAYINNEKVSESSLIVTQSMFIDDRALLLRSGKKSYHLIVIE